MSASRTRQGTAAQPVLGQGLRAPVVSSPWHLSVFAPVQVSNPSAPDDLRISSYTLCFSALTTPALCPYDVIGSLQVVQSVQQCLFERGQEELEVEVVTVVCVCVNSVFISVHQRN